KAVFGTNLLGDCFVDSLVDVCENADLHQVGNDLEGFLLQLVSQLPHHNGWLNRDYLGIRGQNNFRLNGFRGFPWALTASTGSWHTRNSRGPHAANISAFPKIGSAGFLLSLRAFKRRRAFEGGLLRWRFRRWFLRQIDESDLVSDL